MDSVIKKEWIKTSGYPSDFIPAGAEVFIVDDQNSIVKGFYDPKTREIHVQDCGHNHIMPISLNVTTSIADIAAQLDYDTAENLIIAIDLAMADYEFTLGITKKLVAALKEECEAGGEKFNLADSGI